jgi:hypothetical protein
MDIPMRIIEILMVSIAKLVDFLIWGICILAILFVISVMVYPDFLIDIHRNLQNS